MWAVTYTVEDPTVSGTSPQAREEAKQLGIDPLSEEWRRKVTTKTNVHSYHRKLSCVNLC